MSTNQFKINWIQPKSPSDPRYPNGMDVDMASGAKQACLIKLPYPTKPLIGLYHIECTTCGLVIAVTTAGRPDDPKSVIVACRGNHAN